MGGMGPLTRCLQEAMVLSPGSTPEGGLGPGWKGLEAASIPVEPKGRSAGKGQGAHPKRAGMEEEEEWLE